MGRIDMKTKGNRPAWPDCSEVMVKAHEQNEEGDWGVRWLCGCKPSLQIVTALEEIKETWQSAGTGYIDWPEPDQTYGAAKQ